MLGKQKVTEPELHIKSSTRGRKLFKKEICVLLWGNCEQVKDFEKYKSYRNKSQSIRAERLDTWTAKIAQSMQRQSRGPVLLLLAQKKNPLTQEGLDGVQSLLIGHQLRDDRHLAVLAVVEGSLTNRFCSETFCLAVARQTDRWRCVQELKKKKKTKVVNIQPGDVLQSHHLSCLYCSVETVSPHCFHGDDWYVSPADVLQTLDDPAQEPPASHRQQHGARLHSGAQRGGNLRDQSGVAFPVNVCRDEPRNVFILRTHPAETNHFKVFSPEQGVIERRNKRQAFRFCQSESFCVGVVPNLREKQKCAPFFSETYLIILHLTFPLILTVAPWSWSLWTTSRGDDEGTTIVAGTPIFLAA